MEFLQDSNIWFTFSFVIFAYIIAKFGVPAINNMLDGRIADIKKDLEESENLRVEAQEMLAQYQRKHRDAIQEADKILEKSKEDAKLFKANAEAGLKEVMDRREAQLTDRLKRMEQNAIQEIQAYAAELSMNAASQIISDTLDKKTGDKLIEQSISNIKSSIH